MRWQEIQEAREAYLYHITGPDEASRILLTNELQARTDHRVEQLGMVGSKRASPTGLVKGVSLTRNPLFAKTWLDGQGVIFVLDANRLRHNVDLRPVDYYASRTRDGSAAAKRTGHGSVRSESEEFAIGSIRNLDRYLTEVRIPRALYDYCVDDNTDYDDPERDGLYFHLTEYSGLKIV